MVVGVAEPAAWMEAERSAAAAAAWRVKWEVEFSRFFNFPSPSSYSFVSLSLKPLPKAKTRANGTWLTASSLAVLQLARSRAAGSAAVLSAYVLGRVLEEHFISNLNISWPQVSCQPGCPSMGSRVIFFSYTDSSSQTQKFAVRFNASSMVQHFLYSVKECYSDIMDVGLPSSDFPSENSSPFNLIMSSGPGHRVNEESSCSELVDSWTPELPGLSLTGEGIKFPLKPLLANNTEIFSALPQSFTELLTDRTTEIAQTMPVAESDHAEQAVERDLSNCSQNAVSVTEVTNKVEQQMLVEDDLKSQIEKYLSDASFNDLLAKIEKVIDELGGDLAL